MTAKRGKMELGWGKTDQPKPPAASSAPPVPATPEAKARQRRPKGAGDEVGINLRLTPEAWEALHRLNGKLRRAKQDLLLEALDLLLVKYGEEPVARKG